MMRVLLDDQPCEICVDTVMQAISAAAALAEQRGRRIVEVMVDGQLWTARQLDDLAGGERSADEVRLVSANPIDLVCESFEDARASLEQVDHLQQEAAELMQSNKAAEGLRQLNEAIALWLAIQQALKLGCDLAGIQCDAARPASRGAAAVVAPAIDRLNRQLQSVRNALSINDTVALSDALLYDFPDIVDHWREMFVQLQSQVRENVN